MKDAEEEIKKMVKQDIIEPSGYYQIPVAKEDRPNTAFSFPGGGLWQFKRTPMGFIFLISSSASFIRYYVPLNL
jgi:hypothetical protein